MKKVILITIVICLTVGGCRNDTITNPNDQTNLYEYLPLSVGNSWIYRGSTINSAGVVDNSSPSFCTISVLQINTLIGNQPNAFIIHSTNEQGVGNNLAFSISGNVLYHYLGENSNYLLRANIIPWSPGTFTGVKIGLNKSQKFLISDFSGNSNSFTIKRSPDLIIARTNMTTADTIQIQGRSIGNTTFVIQKTNGNLEDTMTVLVEVSTDNRPISPPFSSWIPVWQLTHSKHDDVIYSWDTTYSFRILHDSSLCSDKIAYLITNRFIDNENVEISNSIMNCEKFEMTVLVTETVTRLEYNPFISNENLSVPMILFDGPSTRYTITIWLAKGIGFVKGIVNGNSLPSGVITGGAKDSSGILHGYFFSPRVSYLVMESPSASYILYFHVEDTPLAAKLSSDFFILQSKNF